MKALLDYWISSWAAENEVFTIEQLCEEFHLSAKQIEDMVAEGH